MSPKKTHTKRLIILSLVFLLGGCGLFGENAYEREQRERKEIKQKQATLKKAQLQELENKYNATYFPPKNISSGDFTYKFQEYFNRNNNGNIIFKGDIDDVWAEGDSLFIEFSCSMTDSFSIIDLILNDYDDRLVFRLKIGEVELQNVMNDLSRDDSENELVIDDYYGAFLEEQNREQNLVVARISNVDRGRIYEHSAIGYGEDTEVETDRAKKIIAYGRLISFRKIGIQIEH
jgi:hypothetical protein